MNRTPIEWTDFSANPLKFRDQNGKTVWGCVHASPGCQHCYAETLAKRYGRGGPFNVPTMEKLTPFIDEKELHRMLTYKPASGKRCFVGDMTDVFGEWVPDNYLDALFGVFALRQDVTWQLLTKRASRMATYVAGAVDRVANAIGLGYIGLDEVFYETRSDVANALLGNVIAGKQSDHPYGLPTWPLPNVWLGVSVEDQQRADERIPYLTETPAAVRFVSAEPLLGPIDFSSPVLEVDCADNIDWVIVGGESGPGARPCRVHWIESIVDQCREAGVACFVKQLGRMPTFVSWFRPDWPDHVTYQNDPVHSFILKLSDSKGGTIDEWKRDLRVREFPRSAVPA